jgi:hypothetical protein
MSENLPSDGPKKIWRGLDLKGSADFADRFWSKVDMLGDCWMWLAFCKSNGYGQFTLKSGKFVGAHTVSYALTFGPIPAGCVICHHCDNPPCVNPAHLFLGTQSDNAMDMLAKGRATRVRGTDHPSARLTEEDIRYIRAAANYRGLLKDLSEDFGVSAHTIRMIRKGKTWGHVA